MSDDLNEWRQKAQQAQDAEQEQAGDAAAEFARAVDARAYELRVGEAARRKVAHDAGLVVEPPALVGLRDFLAIADDDAVYRVDELWPIGGRVVLSAAHKVGKSTLIANLLRALVDGEKFLGRYDVEPAGTVGSIVLIDDELDERTLRRWLRQQGIVNVDAVRLLSLRGRVASFDLLDAETRATWADKLRGADVVVLDCLRPVLDALGLDEHREAGRFLVPFDALLAEAGVGEGLVVHHTGHNGDRARGDSRIQDWPDALWTMVKGKGGKDEPEDHGVFAADVPRFLWAYGRDVDVPECELGYDSSARRLSIVGGSRANAKVESALAAVVKLLDVPAGDPDVELSQNQIVDKLKAATEHSRDSLRDACKLGRDRAVLIANEGPNRSLIHFLSPSHRSSERSERQ